MRLHILIYAAKMGTPVIGLTYDPKVEATMHYIGQEFIQPVESINPLTLCRYIDSIMASHQKLTQELQTVGEDSRQKALKNTKLLLELLDTCK
jgi:polysaccharide pyruvyl transferase WcaK-like protein